MSKETIALALFLLLVVAGHASELQGGEGNGGDPALLSGGERVTESMPRDGFKALFVNDQFAGLETFVIYLLEDDKLVQTRFLFPQKHVQSELFLDDFAKVEGVLLEKYGIPAETGKIWRSGNGNNTAKPGRMIAVGELTLKSAWDTADTLIVHTLRGENLDVDHEVNFISKHLTRDAAEVMREMRPKHFF
jgi:hypothetical protein